MGRDAGLYADLPAAWRSEVRKFANSLNTLAYELKRESVRVAIGSTLAAILQA